jgi:hypothetical protein
MAEVVIEDGKGFNDFVQDICGDRKIITRLQRKT